MKAIKIIIAAVLSFQAFFLFAGNDKNSNGKEAFCPSCILVPVTPAVAGFEESNTTSAFTFDITTLAPVAPEEADFSDIFPDDETDLTKLAPVTPAEADFKDADEYPNDITNLAPVTPAEADFE
jgi:hypothetical protein